MQRAKYLPNVAGSAAPTMGSTSDWKVPGEGDTEGTGEAKKRVCYFFDSDIGNFHYGPVHPMKPTRVRMCHSLVMNYGLYKKMEIFRAKPATKREMSQFHSDDYVDFLYRVNPENVHMYSKELMKYNIGDDSPIFDGLFEYTSISAGGSMEGAARLSRDKCDIAVNWAGGLHHAKKAEASGFCYINDIVLGILELLRYHQRVLYIDIDVHHGDGVEEAFYTTDRVMTISFHQYGEFFPGTGELRDTGIGKGKNYSVNVPLREGITDASYQDLFESVVGRSIEWYKPTAIVLQCGADSLSGDKIGRFNLSLQGHADCVSYVKSFNLPLLILGGGGYTIRSVARAWAYETGLAAGVKLGRRIPSNEYYEYYGPDYELDVKRSNMEDLNTPEFLHKVKRAIFEQLRDRQPAPGIQMQAVPRMGHDDDDDEQQEIDRADPDVRISAHARDRRVQNDQDLSDSEDEDGRRHHQSYGPDGMSSKRRGKLPANGEENGNPAVEALRRPRKSVATRSASPSRAPSVAKSATPPASSNLVTGLAPATINGPPNSPGPTAATDASGAASMAPDAMNIDAPGSATQIAPPTSNGAQPAIITAEQSAAPPEPVPEALIDPSLTMSATQKAEEPVAVAAEAAQPMDVDEPTASAEAAVEAPQGPPASADGATQTQAAEQAQ